MRWQWADNGEQELILIDSTGDERAKAERGIAGLRMAGEKGETTGNRLHEAIEKRRLPWKVLESLSSWCNSEGRYEHGVGPAQVVSRALFNEQVLPRLTKFRGDGVTKAIALQRFEKFAETAGIWVDRTLVQEQSRPQSVSEAAPYPMRPMTRIREARDVKGLSLFADACDRLNGRELAEAYRSEGVDAPRRWDSDKLYLTQTRNGIPGTGDFTNRNEEHLAIAIFNAHRPPNDGVRLPNSRKLQILDRTFPLT